MQRDLPRQFEDDQMVKVNFDSFRFPIFSVNISGTLYIFILTGQATRRVLHLQSDRC